MSDQKNVSDMNQALKLLSWYQSDTIRRSIPESGRNLVKYEHQLLFRRSELGGKTVLDLGAGPEAKFAKQLKNYGIDATVISLSPDFSKDLYRKRAKDSFPEGLFVAATAQALPFKDESFDRIFLLHVVDHLSGNAFVKCVCELARVLKVGGKATIGIFPDADNPYTPFLRKDTSAMEQLRHCGVEVLVEKIPKEKAFIPSMKVYWNDDDHCGQRVYDVTCHNIVLVKTQCG